MNVALIDGRNLDSEVLRVWTDLQLGNLELQSPFFSPDFVRSVAMAIDKVEVAMISDNGSVVAIFPFERKSRYSGIPVASILSDYQGLICRPGFSCNPRELLRKCRLSEWSFDHLLTSQTSFAPHHQMHELSPQMDLSKGYAAYALNRRDAGSDLIKKCGNLARRLAREVGPIRFVPDSASRDDLHRTLAWKSRQYMDTTDGWDLFASAWPRAVVEQIYATRAESCAGIFSALYAGDRIVAGHFGMRSRTVWHYWFPSYDKAMAKYSPGLILLLKMAEHASSLGLQTIDLGKGVSPYKARLMTGATQLAAGKIVVPSLASFQRTAMRKIREIVNKSPLSVPARHLIRRIRTAGGAHKGNGTCK